MSKFEEYRRNAEEAQRQADRANSNEIRAAWLQLVQGWLALLPKRDLCENRLSGSVRCKDRGEGSALNVARALRYPSGKRVIVLRAREGNTLSAVFCTSLTHVTKCTVVSADDCDWNDLQVHQPFSKRTACQRKSRASAQTPATDSLAALASRPLSLAIVTKRKPERIMRAA